MFDSDDIKQHYSTLLEEQERTAENYRRWLLSYEQAKLDKCARLMDRRQSKVNRL